MLREIELANLRAALVTLRPGPAPTVTLSLPASKTDSGAQGVARSHACLCTEAPQPGCPVHAAWDQLVILKSRFGARFPGETPAAKLPLFPTLEGLPVTKRSFVETIVFAARLLQVPVVNREGTLRVTGHSLRPTGAQGLARLGLDVWAIQLIGRWGSTAVLGYVRESAAGPEAALARRAQSGRNLQELSAARR